jgi:hypothetical protein
MDPNANLAEQERILTSSPIDRARLRELRDALREWLGNGGFAPDWARHPKAAKYYGK